MRGVETCGETCIVVTNSAHFIEWKGYGLKLHIQENSLPVGTEQATLNIQASVSGDYESPDNYHRVSPVFWFLCEPMCKFEKEVVVEIQHCASPELTSDLRFARAVCSQEILPYTFDLLKSGRFSTKYRYGLQELTKFSGIAAFVRKVFNWLFNINYYARVFYLTNPQLKCPQADVVITLYTETHLKVIITS